MAAERDQREDKTASLPTAVKVWTSVLAVILVIWFLFAWLILDRHVLDAAGESVGTAFAIAVVASLIGAVRSGR
jgi:hypothetical protein